MNQDDSKVNIYASYDEFCAEYGLPTPHRVEFDRTKINQTQLDVLKGYFTNLCLDLTIYKDLFTNAESAVILNEFNSLIFSRIQKAYVGKICLGIACLLDPAETGKNKNLSLEYIINQSQCNELVEKLAVLQKIYIDTGIKKWRQKLLAHNDLNTLMGDSPLELNFGSGDIEHIIELVQEIFDDIIDPKIQTDINVVLPYEKNGSSFTRKLKIANEANKT